MKLGVSSDLERPMKKSRKPSVLVSRQFSCSGALNLQRLKPILSKKNGKEEEQLLIENRKNVTPLPLMSRDLPSIEEINIDQDEYSYDSDSSCLEHAKMSWVPKLLDQIMGETIDATNNNASLQRTRDEIPLFEDDTNSIENTPGDKLITRIDVKSFQVKNTATGKLSKSTHVQAVQPLQVDTAEMETMTMEHEIQDSECNCFSRIFSNRNDAEDQHTLGRKIEDIVNAIVMTNTYSLDTSEGQPANQSILSYQESMHKNDEYIDFDKIVTARKKHQAFHSPAVLKKLKILERILQQNNFRCLYSLSKDIEGSKRASYEQYIFFYCSSISSRVVTCMSWHKKNPDVLAVGYSQVKGNCKENFVMLWSNRNPLYPEKVIRTKSHVTAVAFSYINPALLAVGMATGCIAIFDTSEGDSSKANINTASMPGHHTSPITDLVWITDKQQSPIEKLISVSTDGRILDWSIKKSLVFFPLMTLTHQSSSHSESKVPRIAIPLCIDFPQGDSSTYIVGCEDGLIFLCSRSYTEKPLCQVQGHRGPVNSIKFSPFDKDIVISSSGDSTLLVWKCSSRQNEMSVLLEIKHPDLWGGINDICWSPINSTVFIIASADGSLQVWDLSSRCHTPVTNIYLSKKDRECTNILFKSCGKIITVGDTEGRVELIRLIDPDLAIRRNKDDLRQCLSSTKRNKETYIA